MKFTKEQKAILKSRGDIKINAVAGSGKTTTIIEYARTRPSDSKILYLAFNKSVKIEASKRFIEAGVQNVRVETAHSLAYRAVVHRHGYKINSKGYKTYEIAEILGIPGGKEKHGEYVIANHVKKFTAYFCNSNAQKVQQLNYLETITDTKAKVFVTSFYKIIENQTRLFLAKMDRGLIEITHDFYLKKFQLSRPNLPYDYILFDEGQDASPTMLDVFLNQNAVKVIVGDTHQQIYGWRYAVNSLEKANFKTFQLSSSFRFSQEIADLAVDVIYWKDHLESIPDMKMVGKGTSDDRKTKAILARTNLGLLLKAIDIVSNRSSLKSIYFEGSIHSYTYAEEGASLYDVLNLYNGKKHLIRDEMIKKMNTLEDLEEYVEKTEEVDLTLMIEIIKEYGNRIPGILNRIKELHIDGNDKEKADLIFSTVHRSKGMEYDTVEIVNDFLSEERLEKLIEEKEADPDKLKEEINLLYVAITRTKNKLYIPETLVPEDFKSTKHIIVTQPETVHKMAKSVDKNDAVSIKRPGASNQKWSDFDDEELTDMFCDGLSVPEMASHLKRSQGSVVYRIKKLRLEETYGYY
ncbi:UvrD-helicase domain-containing protein [Portibacter lacus]|uniref:DNA 3'-5' helicase n=1 Tax=Portibacter lacus TaxID=1099794 RepID=A0AA37SQI8_9BACT|nr:UvrD-helicase domain-containing protein [Portibacter lacus]GLR17061.1 DNA helicase [Portibacter lacus]